ncbi:MAG: NYN domain-containing protein [Bosea sp. (in: a-proteobacteria)]
MTTDAMPNHKIALFIDGANFYGTAKQLGFEIDYRRLLKEFQGRGFLLRAFYYTALVESEEYSSIRPLVDWLDYNGFRVVTKPVKEFTDASGRRRFKGNMDVELTIDAMELSPHIDQMVLFSGDGDFTPLVIAMQRKGVKVSVVSTVTSNPPMIADDLRRQCDEFIDLAQLMPRIGRDPGEKTDRGTRPVPAGTPANPSLERRYGIRRGDEE